MFNNALICAICTLCLFLSACVTKDKYTELETNLSSQLKDRDDALADLQGRHRQLEGEKEQLLKRIEGLKLNLGQARSDVEQNTTMIEELTLGLGKSQAVIR